MKELSCSKTTVLEVHNDEIAVKKMARKVKKEKTFSRYKMSTNVVLTYTNTLREHKYNSWPTSISSWWRRCWGRFGKAWGMLSWVLAAREISHMARINDKHVTGRGGILCNKINISFIEYKAWKFYISMNTVKNTFTGKGR